MILGVQCSAKFTKMRIPEARESDFLRFQLPSGTSTEKTGPSASVIGESCQGDSKRMGTKFS
jgi:hypothetical protein